MIFFYFFLHGEKEGWYNYHRKDNIMGPWSAAITLIIVIVGLALFFAPLFIWNRCNQILEEKKRANKKAEEQREKITKLLSFIANELTKR